MRSLLAPAFFLGSLLVTGACASDPSAASTTSTSDAHAMQEQKKAAKPTPREEVTKAIQALEKANRDLAAAKDPQQYTHTSCDAVSNKGCDPSWPTTGDKPCDQPEKTDRKFCMSCNKLVKKCAAAKTKAMNKKISLAERNIPKAEKQLDKAETKCRAQLFKKCRRDCVNGKATGFEASNCVCSCKPGWFGEKCDQSTRKVPSVGVATAAATCCEPGVRSITGENATATKWRASFPDDHLNSRMPGVVFDASTSGSTVSVVCDHTRNGPLAVKHELHKDDTPVDKKTGKSLGKRSESHTHDETRPAAYSGLKQAPVSGIEKGKETYYGMSIYLGGEDAWPYYTDGTTPPAADGLVNRDGPLVRSNCKQADILFQWKANAGKPFMTLQQKYQGLYLNSQTGAWLTLVKTMDRSKWYDIRIRVKWETEASGQGEIEAQIKTADQSTYGIPTWKGQAKDEFGKPSEKVWHGATMDREADAYLKWGLYLDHWRVAAQDDDTADGYYIHGNYTDDATGESKFNYQLHTLFNSRTVWHDNIAVGDCWNSVDPSAKDCDLMETATCNTTAPDQQ